jgi:hypothetical protein
MRVEISTLLDCPPERAWQEVNTTRLMRYVAHPLQVFTPIEPLALPTVWQEGKYLVALKSFGFIPLGKQWINIKFLPPDTTSGKLLYQLRDNGNGQIARKWDHMITLRETEDGLTHYTDSVEVRAGIFTLFVWLYAHFFYRYRQARWRRLVQRNFQYNI